MCLLLDTIEEKRNIHDNEFDTQSDDCFGCSSTLAEQAM